MKKFLFTLFLASCLLFSGCFTTLSVDEKQYWAIPVTVPLDAVTLPAQLGLLYMFRDLADVK